MTIREQYKRFCFDNKFWIKQSLVIFLVVFAVVFLNTWSLMRQLGKQISPAEWIGQNELWIGLLVFGWSMIYDSVRDGKATREWLVTLPISGKWFTLFELAQKLMIAIAMYIVYDAILLVSLLVYTNSPFSMCTIDGAAMHDIFLTIIFTMILVVNYVLFLHLFSMNCKNRIFGGVLAQGFLICNLCIGSYLSSVNLPFVGLWKYTYSYNSIIALVDKGLAATPATVLFMTLSATAILLALIILSARNRKQIPSRLFYHPLFALGVVELIGLIVYTFFCVDEAFYPFARIHAYLFGEDDSVQVPFSVFVGLELFGLAAFLIYTYRPRFRKKAYADKCFPDDRKMQMKKTPEYKHTFLGQFRRYLIANRSFYKKAFVIGAIIAVCLQILPLKDTERLEYADECNRRIVNTVLSANPDWSWVKDWVYKDYNMDPADPYVPSNDQINDTYKEFRMKYELFEDEYFEHEEALQNNQRTYQSDYYYYYKYYPVFGTPIHIPELLQKHARLTHKSKDFTDEYVLCFYSASNYILCVFVTILVLWRQKRYRGTMQQEYNLTLPFTKRQTFIYDLLANAFAIFGSFLAVSFLVGLGLLIAGKHGSFWMLSALTSTIFVGGYYIFLQCIKELFRNAFSGVILGFAFFWSLFAGEFYFYQEPAVIVGISLLVVLFTLWQGKKNNLLDYHFVRGRTTRILFPLLFAIRIREIGGYDHITLSQIMDATAIFLLLFALLELSGHAPNWNRRIEAAIEKRGAR